MKSNDIILKSKQRDRMILAAVIVLMCALDASLWKYLDNQRNSELHNILTSKANEYSSHIAADIRTRIPSLQRIAHRWQWRNGTPKPEFLLDAREYINDLPGFQALEWVDSGFHVRWIEPLAGNEKAINLNLALEEKRRLALEHARDKGMPTMTSPIELVQGGKGFLIYVPIFVKNKFDGFVLAVFRMQTWLDYVFSFKPVYAEKPFYRISVTFDDVKVYKQKDDTENKRTEWQAISSITIMDKELHVTVMPTDTFFSNEMTSEPEVVAAAGMLLSFIIFIMIYLMQKTNIAFEKVHEINITLKENIEKRMRAEKDAIQANKAKSKFLSSMSHELRTPLNAIIGFSQLLEATAEDGPTKQNTQEINKAGKHLLELINEILDLSKIESGKIDIVIDDHNFGNILDECISLITPTAEEHKIKIQNDNASTQNYLIRCDGRRLKQVLINLLSNAVKYNSDNGSIIINCTPADENMLQISITDTGAGFSPEKLDVLFMAFERVQTEYSSIEGTGLGLAISKRLIELMSGSIGAESQIGKGACFWIKIPLAESETGNDR